MHVVMQYWVVGLARGCPGESERVGITSSHLDGLFASASAADNSLCAGDFIETRCSSKFSIQAFMGHRCIIALHLRCHILIGKVHC